MLFIKPQTALDSIASGTRTLDGWVRDDKGNHCVRLINHDLATLDWVILYDAHEREFFGIPDTEAEAYDTLARMAYDFEDSRTEEAERDNA